MLHKPKGMQIDAHVVETRHMDQPEVFGLHATSGAGLPNGIIADYVDAASEALVLSKWVDV